MNAMARKIDFNKLTDDQIIDGLATNLKLTEESFILATRFYGEAQRRKLNVSLMLTGVAAEVLMVLRGKVLPRVFLDMAGTAAFRDACSLEISEQQRIVNKPIEIKTAGGKVKSAPFKELTPSERQQAIDRSRGVILPAKDQVVRTKRTKLAVHSITIKVTPAEYNKLLIVAANRNTNIVKMTRDDWQRAGYLD